MYFDSSTRLIEGMRTHLLSRYARGYRIPILTRPILIPLSTSYYIKPSRKSDYLNTCFPLYSGLQKRHTSSDRVSSGRRRGPTITAKDDSTDSCEFTCDEEPHMLGTIYDGAVGYMPLQLGQTLEDHEGGKYEIVRKLGWGSNASVWLAKRREGNDERYVAIKILTVTHTRGIELGDFYELEVWRRFRELHKKYEGAPEHLGYEFCVKPQNAFVAESSHGSHLCFVTQPFGSTVDELQLAQPGLTFPLPVVKNIVKQTLVALHFVHTEIGVVHGDVKAANLLIDLYAGKEELDQYLQDNPSDTYPPRSAPELWSGLIITVKSQPLPNMGLHSSLDNLKVSLGDFGGCCMVFECLTGVSLFQVQPMPNLDPLKIHLGRIVEHLGAFPAKFVNACSKRAEFFDETGTLLYVPSPLPAGSLESWFGGFLHIRETLSEKDVKATCAFMRRCLVIEPSARATAAELLSDEWFKA